MQGTKMNTGKHFQTLLIKLFYENFRCYLNHFFQIFITAYMAKYLEDIAKKTNLQKLTIKITTHYKNTLREREVNVKFIISDAVDL